MPVARGTEFGLGEMGPALLREMERVGIMLDLTHLTDQAFWQALEIYNGPVLASHNNLPSDRAPPAPIQR